MAAINKKDKKINFVLSKKEYEIIKYVQDKLNLNTSDISREALKIYSWAQTEVDQHNIDSTPSEFIKNAMTSLSSRKKTCETL